ncbi:ABC transporter substrate-binding protein [Dactylosporangium sp. NPDC051485]|uniref:ABC transporter substrate-binding protein n=1 Tax=Dactylosporangium sp. NPDC051485 TaxID=3154846 RepID=UPI00343D973E
MAAGACGSSSADGASKPPNNTPASADAGAIPAYTGPAPSDANPVKVGVLYTDTNPVGVTPEIKDAAKAAAEFINSQGGMDGRKLEIVACNGANNPQSAARCANEFVDNKVVTVYGLDGTWGGVGVSIIGKAGIVNQTMPISGPELTAENAYPWLGAALTGAAAVVSYAKENGGKAACVYQEVAAFQERCVKFFSDFAKKAGVESETIPVPTTANDLAQYATRIKGTNAKTVWVIGGEKMVQSTVLSSAQLGYKPQWISSVQRPDFWKAVGKAGEGMIEWADLKDAQEPNDKEAALFRAVMNKYAPDSPAGKSGFAVMSFSNLMTLQRLAKKVGGDQITAANMPKLLSEINVQQFMGPVLDASKAPQGYPHLVHPGAYLYKRVGDGSELAGKGYYSVAE